MKKEAVNTFSEGLNYDLHPLVTPNNLLTDVVNGTFITFNGNELSLQNDAGNIVLNIKNSNDNIPTYIPGKLDYAIGDLVAITDSSNRLRYYECLLAGTTEVPSDDNINWREYIVRLSPGFVPIAMKEYGGVLYIISRKQIGNEPDPDVDLIEFGSYPSPEKYTQQEGTSKVFTINMIDINNDTIVDIPNILYSPKIINNLIFRPGEYTKFNVNTTGLDITYLSNLSTSKFYKLKLLQQLSSGYLDLTSDIEEKYQDFGGTYDHWILDPDFIYPCPFLYKGNLALQLEVEPLVSFEIVNPPELSYIINSLGNTFSIELTARIEFESGTYNIKAEDILTTALIENLEVGVDFGTITNTSLVVDSTSCTKTITIEDIPADYTGNVLDITLTPSYVVNSTNITNDLPSEYTNNYILQSKIVLSDIYSNVTFPYELANLYSDQNTCSSTYYGYKIYNEIVLANGSGLLIDSDLEITDTPHVLVSYGTLPSTGNTLIGTYEIDYNTGLINWASATPIIWEPGISEDVKTIISAGLLYKELKVEDELCKVYKLTIIVSGQIEADVTVKQSVSGINETKTGNYLEFYVTPGYATSVKIVPVSHEYLEIIDTVYISEDTTYNYTLIGKVGYYKNTSDLYYVLWDGSIDLGNPEMEVTHIYTSGSQSWNAVVDGKLLYSTELGSNKNIFEWDTLNVAGNIFNYGDFYYTFNTPHILSYEFTVIGNELTSTYRNTQNISDYIEINGIVFKKSGIFDLESYYNVLN